MNTRLYNKLLEMSFEKLTLIRGQSKHFTFLLNKNRIIHMGWNDYDQSHPILLTLGYGEKRIHSEVAAIMPFRKNLNALKGFDLCNIRVNRFGEIRMSMPCTNCWSWVKMVGFKNVYYTDPFGQLQRM